MAIFVNGDWAAEDFSKRGTFFSNREFKGKAIADKKREKEKKKRKRIDGMGFVNVIWL